MAKITNTSKHPVRNFVGGEVVDLAPGKSAEVPNSKDWESNVFVKAGWLKYETTKAGGEKPMTIADIKDALAEQGIEIPEGVTKRDELLALLEGSETNGEK